MLSQSRAGAEEQRANGGFASSEDLRDLGGFHLVNRGEQQDVAFAFGQPLDGGEHKRHAACFVERVVGGEGLRGERPGEGFVQLLGADAPSAVDGEVPGDAHQPDAQVAHIGQRAAMFEHAWPTTTRHLQVLKEFKDNSIVASICPKISADNMKNNADYGYNPAVKAIIDRLKEALKGKCLPRPLVPAEQAQDGLEAGQVPCKVIEAVLPQNGGACSCTVDTNRDRKSVV